MDSEPVLPVMKGDSYELGKTQCSFPKPTQYFLLDDMIKGLLGRGGWEQVVFNNY